MRLTFWPGHSIIAGACYGIESGDYLALLETFYDEWIEGFDLCPLLTIRTDDLDFVHRPGHLDIVIQRIQDRLAGREEVVFPLETNRG